MRLRFRDVKAIPNMTAEEYHGKPYDSLSASRLKLMLDGGEREFELKIIRGLYNDSEKAHYKMGQLLHHVVLESQKVDETNFTSHTCAMFETRSAPSTEPSIVHRDAAGFAVDEIWVVNTPVPGIFRRSRQWGPVNGCHWRHEFDLVEMPEDEIDELEDPEPLLCGFAAFQDMLIDGDGFRAVPYDLLGKNGSKGTTAFKKWKREHRGERIMDATGDGSWHQVIRMRQELRMSDPARTLLFDYPEECLVEYTLVGYDVDFGYEVRTRMDRARPFSRVLHVTDLKTSRDAEPKAWQKQCWSDHLPMQAWMMTQLGAAAFGMDVEYKYVAVGKGIDCRVEVHEADNETIEIGGEMYDEAVTRFQQCQRSGIWRPKSHGQIHRISPPPWMMKERSLKRGVRGTGAEKFYEDYE